MIRLTLLLCAGLFGALWVANQIEPRAVVASTPDAAPRIKLQERPNKKAAVPSPVVIAPAPAVAPLPEGVTITPVSLGNGSAGLVQMSHRDAPAGYVPVRVATTAAPTDGEMAVITGKRVNLRAGPGTNNAVVGSMTRDMRVTVLARPGNGWVQIHHADSGLSGFMAARFTAPAQ